ncbi:hypothetical protein B296_00047908 [Ensete ventricosum]|uniref:TAZ-type domain-containing protein n=1 Tax=Ensete ventricosum TaxID=4639 RepID=A0A426X7T3_ENSVE|nr:hypothetical protein B296_00047908 [Ensete ventricosum]
MGVTITIRSGVWSREAEEEMERHGMALLALSHAYRMRWLKRRCEAGVAARLSAVKVMDVLKLARLCDAPRLYQRCMRLVAKDSEAVRQSEGWRFVQKHDPGLEMEVLQFLQETSQVCDLTVVMDACVISCTCQISPPSCNSGWMSMSFQSWQMTIDHSLISFGIQWHAQREKRWRRERGDQEMYRQLSEAMDCLQHICTEGCTDVGPHNSRPPAYPCASFSTCEGLQLLIRHFAACGRKLPPKGCTHCKRMWQLLRLHSSLCDQPDSCRVPLCEQFKKKAQEEKVDRTWRLLVKKVATARVMSSLANRKVPEIVQKSRMRYRGTR